MKVDLLAGHPSESAHAAPPSPRSSRDLDILRSLSRRIDATDPGAHNNLGVVFFNKGLYEDAIVEFERALDRDPGLELAARNLELALSHTGLGARRVAELLRDGAGKGEAQTRHRLARLYYANGDYQSAEQEWNGLLARTPGDAAAHLWLARTALKRDDSETVHAHLKYALERAQNDAALLARVGEMFMRAGAAEDALRALERARELDGSLPGVHALLADLYRAAGDEQTATAMEAAAQEHPANSVASLSLERHGVLRPMDSAGESPKIAQATLAHYNRGLALRRDGDFDGAGAAFDAALAAGEDRFIVRQALGELALLRGDSGHAAEIYASLVEEEPASPKLWNERGVAAHQHGSLAEAEEAYRRAIALDGTYALAWNNLGVVRHHTGDAAEAERSFRQAIAHGRAPAEVWRNLGLMLTRHARHEQARDAFRRALELEPESATAWSGMGAVLMEMGRAEDARNALMRAVDADEDLAEARYQLAFALSALGDYRGALRETKRAIELDPYYPAPRFRLLIDVQFEEARLLAPELEVTEVVQPGESVESFDFREGALDFVFGELSAGVPAARPAEAADAAALNVAQASADGAERAEILLMLGELFLQRGLAGEANERFEAVLAAGPDISLEDRRRASLGRVRGLLMLDRFVEARNAAADLAAADAKDAEALQLLGDALLRNGEAGAAADVLQRATVQAPDDASLHAALGAAQWHAGNAEKAERTLRRALELNPAAATARVSLGRILEESGRLEAATDEYRAALETIPSFGGAALALAGLEDARGNLRGATRVLIDLLELDPYHLDALFQLAVALRRAGRDADARTALERVLRFDPGHEGAADLLRRILETER